MTRRRSDEPLDEDMEAVVLAHQGALITHCYRFLGSVPDAEEAVQETFLRAWQHRDDFRGESLTRTWLFSIATRVCLDLLRGRKRRMLPVDLGTASSPTRPFMAPPEDVAWLGPLPTAYLTDSPNDPASIYSSAESVRLAFVAALQTLTAQQRAVLILRDVLALSAAEVANALECSVSSVTSSLHRARLQMQRTHHDTGVTSFPDAAIEDPVVADTLASFVRAWQTNDLDALVRTLREDVRLAMPPVPSWFAGRDDVIALLAGSVLPLGRFRLRPAFFNAQPGFTLVVTRSDGVIDEIGQMILGVDASGIFRIDVFEPV